jgi:glycine/D-amino acid oxidase-like deaminating enzyme
MLDWLIIGGGIHGVHAAHVLVNGQGWPRDRVQLLDPHPELLANWTRLTGNVGMAFMRSPGVHHLGLEARDLTKYARRQTAVSHRLFAEPYQRPTYALFQAHNQHLIHTYRLDELHIQGAAQGLARQRDGWRVETEQGVLAAKRVLLAIGRSRPHWPEWAVVGRALGLPIQHIFASDYTPPHSARRTLHAAMLVVGGGITAAQAALRLAEQQQPGAVTLLMRHPIREHQFDSDPGWLGPKYQDRLHKTADYAQRRQMIQTARHRGSMPPEVVRKVRRAQKTAELCVQEGEITAVVPVLQNGRIELVCRDGQHIWAEQVVLATGFNPARPGGAWLDAAIAANDLPVAPCGYPLVDKTLCWAPGLYVTGTLAELEMGPIAANIAGARQAVRRLVRA